MWDIKGYSLPLFSEKLFIFSELRKQGGSGGGKTGLASALALSALLPNSPLHRPGFEIALGLDFGGVAAFSAAAAYWPETGLLDGFQACGGDPVLSERAKADQVPGVYEKMEARGELIVMGGKVVPIPDFLKECVLRWGPPSAIACDRWREGELVDAVNQLKLRGIIYLVNQEGIKKGQLSQTASCRKGLFSSFSPGCSCPLQT